METYLDESDELKVEIEVLELLMDPEDSEVCLRVILTHARRGSRIFETFSTKEKNDKVAKRFAKRELRRNDGEGSSVPLKKDEDAAAAAGFFVDNGGRKLVEFSKRAAIASQEKAWKESRGTEVEDKRKWCGEKDAEILGRQ